jgi:ribosome-associated protein
MEIAHFSRFIQKANAVEYQRPGIEPGSMSRAARTRAPGRCLSWMIPQRLARPTLPRPTRHPNGGPLNDNATAIATPPREQVSLELAIQCARIGADNKAKDVVILDLRGITPIFDYFVLMTGASRRQMHTLAEETDAFMRAEGEKRLSIQGYQASRWIVQDYGDIVVHVFDPDAREYYAIEDLWADAKRVEWKRD